MIILWLIFIRPLFKFQDYASRHIRRVTFSKLVDIDKNILTISSAAIILTISLIQNKLLFDLYLISSWISFLISITAGILLYIAYFTHDYTDEILINSYYKLLNKSAGEEEINQSEINKVDSIKRNNKTLVRSIFILLYIEMTYLIMALLFLTIFGYNNLTK
jgi:hypothetical protein